MINMELKKKYIASELHKILNCFDKNIYRVNIQKTHIDELPKTLYKYLSLQKDEKGQQFSLINLKNTQITSSRPKDFNDPYDCALYIDKIKFVYMTRNLPEYKNIINEKNIDNKLYEDIINTVWKDEDILLDFKKILGDIINKISIGCLSENKESILMWSHYADNHRGFAIEYDFDEIKALNNILLPVLYTTQMNELSKAFTYGYDVEIYYSLITKAKEWEYENEWRIINADTQFCKIRERVSMPKPKAIYVGCKTNLEDEKKLVDFCIYNDIQIYKMKMKEDAFKLEYVPIKYYEEYKFIKRQLILSKHDYKYSLIGLNEKFRNIIMKVSL